MSVPAAFAANPETMFYGEYANIPERMQNALIRYVVDRITPGDFLRAVICNNLRLAVAHADEENLPLLRLYTQWFYNVAPSGCHGSPEALQEWVSVPAPRRAADNA